MSRDVQFHNSKVIFPFVSEIVKCEEMLEKDVSCSEMSKCKSSDEPRRSRRERHSPARLSNYITHATIKYHHAFLSKIMTVKEPHIYREAVKDPRWVEAMKNETNALEENMTWKLCQLLPGKKE